MVSISAYRCAWSGQSCKSGKLTVTIVEKQQQKTTTTRVENYCCLQTSGTLKTVATGC